jgi:hypothetical protein
MSRYQTHVADAPWCKCKVCGKQAVVGIDVVPEKLGNNILDASE